MSVVAVMLPLQYELRAARLEIGDIMDRLDVVYGAVHRKLTEVERADKDGTSGKEMGALWDALHLISRTREDLHRTREDIKRSQEAFTAIRTIVVEVLSTEGEKT